MTLSLVVVEADRVHARLLGIINKLDLISSLTLEMKMTRGA